MDKIVIKGGIPLKGKIHISGAKNAALPLMAASLLTEEPLNLSNMPDLADISSMIELLNQLGCEATKRDDVLKLQAAEIKDPTAPYEIVRKMRASILVLGPLMARAHEAMVSLPGGCAIGTRPVDIHIKGLEAMGAKIEIKEGYIHAKAPSGLKGAEFVFPTTTVTGTENLMMAATLAKGKTKLLNAAKEPEVVNLAECLVAMGAKISGIGSTILEIEGVDRLSGADHRVIPDRIEAGTYAIAAAITHGSVDLLGVDEELLPSFLDILRATGVKVTPISDGIHVECEEDSWRSINIETHPYPGFPTDLQAQFMALMCLASGTSTIHETIFENRFMHVPELSRMGADIKIEGSKAIVKGVSKLKGAPVMATDLRASVSLVLAGLAAKGQTTISRVYHLDRGYEKIEEKLRNCGASISRIHDDSEDEANLKLVQSVS